MVKVKAEGKFRNFRILFPQESVFSADDILEVVGVDDKLTIDRVDQCEYELLDPDFNDCAASATHFVREMGIAVCGGHVDAVQALAKHRAEEFENFVMAHQPVRAEQAAGDVIKGNEEDEGVKSEAKSEEVKIPSGEIKLPGADSAGGQAPADEQRPGSN